MFFGKCRPRGAKPKMMCVYLVFCAVIFLLHLQESFAGHHEQKQRDRTNNPCQLVSMKGVHLKESRNSKCQEDCEKMAKEWSNYESAVREHYHTEHEDDIDAKVHEWFEDSSCTDLTLGSCKYAICTCSHANLPGKVSTNPDVSTHHEKVPTHHEKVPTHHETVPTGRVLHISRHLKTCRKMAKIFAEKLLDIEKLHL